MSPKPTSGECKRGDFSHMSRAQRDQMEYELFAMFVQLRLIGQGPGLRKSALILARFTDTCRRLRSTMSAITASGSQGGESRPKKAI